MLLRESSAIIRYEIQRDITFELQNIVPTGIMAYLVRGSYDIPAGLMPRSKEEYNAQQVIILSDNMHRKIDELMEAF